MDANEFSLLKYHVDQAVQNAVTAIRSISIEIRQDIEMDFMILTSLIIRPELYDYSNSELLPSIFTMIADLDESMLTTFSSNFIESFLNCIERYYTKLLYELNIQMGYYNETYYDTSISFSTYSEKLSSMKTHSQTAWIALEKFLSKLSNTTTESIQRLQYETVATSTRLLVINWIAKPLFLSNDDQYRFIDDLNTVVIVDTDNSSLSTSSKNITITNTYFYDVNNIGCKAWTVNVTENTIQDKTCTAEVISTDTGNTF